MAAAAEVAGRRRGDGLVERAADGLRGRRRRGVRHARGGAFFADLRWAPSAGRYGLLALAAATAAVALGALTLAAPAGVAAAVFVHAYAPRPLAVACRRALELLAGIPSVVYGFWGLVTLVPLVAKLGGGAGACLLTATLVLALMVLPTVALLSEAALAAVASDQPRGGAALGLGRWATLRRVVLPAAGPGVASAVLLAGLRAVGETMAVLMVAGNTIALPGDPFAPVRVLTGHIALEMGYAAGDHRAALFFCGAVLLTLVAAGVLAADLLERGRRKAAAGG